MIIIILPIRIWRMFICPRVLLTQSRLNLCNLKVWQVSAFLTFLYGSVAVHPVFSLVKPPHMASEYIPRASLDLLQPGLVDAELKSLKLLFRRLQSSLTILGSELQLLRRLYYKNKNQHRGALFWRNVAELQRYLHKLENLNVQEPTLTLRNKFYGPTAR